MKNFLSSYVWGGAYAHTSSQKIRVEFFKIGKITTVALLRSENSVFSMKFKIVEEVKLGPYTETSDSSTLLDKVIKVSNIGKCVYGMRDVLEVSASV